MDTSFNDSSNVFENDVQYFETFNSILKVVDEREAELSNSRLFSLWENVYKSENVLDQKIKKSASYQGYFYYVLWRSLRDRITSKIR
ncbi:unnamed protein product [Meloidogyne enterolobii]|uniref:Uncharacterized protein n=1 Tax=Meloidogyne enterolobii TaxID=390850 RepID=A0ACB1A8Q3_MELEN